MTKLKLFIFICFCALSTITQAQYTLTIDDVDFSDGQITDYTNATEKNIIIPDNFNDVAVSSIGNEAFYGNDLTEVIIPNSVKSIGEDAFYDNKLTEVIIGNSVTSIGDGAFYDNDLTEVSIPNSVKIIGGAAFLENELTHVSIGNHVTSIGNRAFEGNQLTEVIIPNSVLTIGDDAFQDNKLTNVIIPNSVTSIGNNAFRDNTGLTSFNLPTHHQGYSYPWSNSKKSGDEITDLALSYELYEDSKGNAVDFTISYTLDGGTNAANNPADYTVETATITLADASKTGRTFKGWYSDAAFTADNEVTEIATGSTGPKEFFAKFSDAITYNITYNLDGGTNAANNPADYTVESATITLADASKDGYTFGGWYSEAAFTNQVTEIATGSTGPKEFFAKFSETYNITYNLDGGTNGSNPISYTVKTATITLADASKDGYTFEGWYSDAAFTADNEVTEIATGSTGHKEFFAKFSDAITYDITYTLDGGTNDANNPADYTVETATITLADASKTGRTFKGWYSDAAFTADNEVTEITTGSTGDISLYAKYSDEYTLQLSDVDFSDGEITAYTNTTEKNIIIPDNFDGVAVKSIGKDAFRFNLLTQVSIPNSVSSIGDAAFAGNQLTEVSIPNSVKSIGEYAFSDNTGLTSFNLPAHYQGSSYPWSNGKKSGDEITDFALSYELDEDSKGDAVDFTITYTLDGGTNDANNPANYTIETETIILAEASKDGYTFEGWYSDAAFTADNEVTEIATGSTGDVVLFAKYSEIALGIYTTNIKVFNFYPNPSIDFIQTELEVSSLTIRSISGSKVKQFEGGSFFDISNLKSGVYILLAIDKNGDTYKSKLLKE